MARRRTPAQLAAALDRVVTKPAGADQEQGTDRDERQDLEQAGGQVDVDHGPAGPGHARRVVVRVPGALKHRLELHARRSGRTYTAVVLDAYREHAGELGDVARPAARPAEPSGLPLLPERDVGAAGRRRGINAVDLPLSLYPAEREVLEAAVGAGVAHTLSDLVTRLLELALPAPHRRR